MNFITDKLDRAAEHAPLYEDYPEFTPFTTPAWLMRLGVFDGTYFRHDPESCPKDAIIVASHNLFAAHVSLSRKEWQANGWITPEDPLGWFQWFCRFHEGRRIHDLDDAQISRWRAYRRHLGQVKSMGGRDVKKRIRQRQSLLHWAHDPIPDFR